MSRVVTPTPALLEQYERDGVLVLPDVLAADEVAVLRRGVERVFAVHSPDADLYPKEFHMQEIWRPKMFEHGAEFEALVDHPGIAQLVDAILGDDCHLIANSAMRTPPGKTLSTWHSDEGVRFPRPPDVPLDRRHPMPTFVLNIHYYLGDVDEALGPTQFVPGSHRSGRGPEPADLDATGNPSYEGRGVLSAVGPAGTCVMWNDQTWHRGGPNVSDNRIRWAVQTPFARRWIAQRFHPYVNYRFPEEILARANPRRRRLFGVHAVGSYG